MKKQIVIELERCPVDVNNVKTYAGKIWGVVGKKRTTKRSQWFVGSPEKVLDKLKEELSIIEQWMEQIQ